MITISKYWKRWSNPRLIVLVLNNRDLNQVTWEERVTAQSWKDSELNAKPFRIFPITNTAELIGLEGHLR